MFRPWVLLRRLRQRATPLPRERGEIEVYLRKKGAFQERVQIASWARVLCGVVAAVLVLCVSVSSYAYASETVLPDTPLYPVREVIEQVQVALAVTPVQKKTVEKKLEVRRQKEVEKLTELQRPVPVKLKKYVGAAATTTKVLLKNTLQQRKAAEKTQREAQRKQKQEEAKALRAQKQRQRQTLLEQRRIVLEKRAQERQKQREEARERRRAKRAERERER